MNLNLLTKKVFSLIAVLIIAILCTFNCMAVDNDGDGIDDDPVYTESQTEYIEPETQEYTEYIEPTTEYVEPVTEYIEPETEYVQPETEEVVPVTYPAYIVETYPVDESASTDYQAPTLDKTISLKTYSTNFTAGIISWLCVIIGGITVAVVLVSTKLSKIKN